MTAGGQLLLLDTSVILHLVRGKATGLAIDAAYNLRTRPERPLASVISIGEILSFANQRGWSTAKAVFGQWPGDDRRRRSPAGRAPKLRRVRRGESARNLAQHAITLGTSTEAPNVTPRAQRSGGSGGPRSRTAPQTATISIRLARGRTR